MAYIGNTNTTQGFIPAVDYFNGDGATVAFTLSRPVASVAQVQAVIENVPQAPGSAYTVSGQTITFDSAPPNGTGNIYVYYTSPITQVIQPSQGTVATSSFAANAVAPTADALNPANAYTGDSFSDVDGDVRLLPINAQTAAYVIAASDNGKVISITTGGVTVNDSIMSTGMVVTIYNNSASSQTITQGSGVTLQWAGQATSTTGTRTLGLYGMATILFLSASSAVITGSGLT
jgi:hypothetical protein